MIQQPKFDTLPPECIVLILNHVFPNDLDNIRLINRLFYQIIESNVKRLPKYKIETIINFEADGYFIYHYLPNEITPITVPKKVLKRCEISKITLSHTKLSLKPIIEKWKSFKLFENLNTIEFRGCNWEIIEILFGSLIKNVKTIKILDLNCLSSILPLNSMYFQIISYDLVQIIGCKNSFHELQSFIKLWKTTCKPKIFDKITLCFGTQSLEENHWLNIYPTFSIPHKQDNNIQLIGNFIEQNCLQMRISVK
uniref:F-box domain-containing protein n=1 Tax=Panagrolaimus sp. PS1159 TaxID=55785 RepID=A0AC35EU30_9BILA